MPLSCTPAPPKQATRTCAHPASQSLSSDPLDFGPHQTRPARLREAYNPFQSVLYPGITAHQFAFLTSDHTLVSALNSD